MHKLKFLAVIVLALIPVSLSAIPVRASAGFTMATHPHINLIRHGSSTNWSGYAVETNLTTPTSHAVSNVQGQWTVPAVTCGAPSTYSSIWVGIDGYSDDTVQQTGTEQDCRNGQPQYYAWFEMYPQPSFKISFPIHPGDVISASVKYLRSSSYTLTLNDVTSGRHYVNTRSLSGTQRQSAEWVVEAPSSFFGVLPLANYGTATFTNASATINGLTSTISEPTWQNDPITMTEQNSPTPRSTPGALSPDGSSFTTTWNHI